MFFRPPRLLSATLLLIAVTARAEDRWAPHAEAGPVDQKLLSGNACGPAALLTAVRCGDDKWQALATRLPGRSAKSKMRYIIRAHGLRPSASLKGRNRWSADGINAEDLTDIAGELAAIGGLPPPRNEALFRGRRESAAKLLRRTHDRLRDSLARGLPPVVGLTRHVRRDGRWQPLRNHFVTVVRVPEKLDRNATEFTFTYFDPWGGRKREGTLRLPARPILAAPGRESPCLEALVPGATIGREQVRAGETSVVVPATVIGRR